MNIFFIPSVITRLEARHIKVEEVSVIIKDLQANLNDERLKKKFEEILKKNNDIYLFFNFDIYKCDIKDRKFLFAPLTSVKAERSFSTYDHILSKRRSNMSIETLAACLFLDIIMRKRNKNLIKFKH